MGTGLDLALSTYRNPPENTLGLRIAVNGSIDLFHESLSEIQD